MADPAFKEKRLQQAIDGASAMGEYRTAEAGISAKIARLKALRLARDAAPVIIPLAPKRKRASQNKKTPVAAISLSTPKIRKSRIAAVRRD